MAHAAVVAVVAAVVVSAAAVLAPSRQTRAAPTATGTPRPLPGCKTRLSANALAVRFLSLWVCVHKSPARESLNALNRRTLSRADSARARISPTGGRKWVVYKATKSYYNSICSNVIK